MPIYRSLLIAVCSAIIPLAVRADEKPTPEEHQYRLGREGATRDTTQGRYSIKVFALGHANRDSPALDVLSEYQITVGGRGCRRWQGEADFYRGYNEVGKPAIEKKYGAGIWKTLESEARTALKDWPKDRETPAYNLIARWAKEAKTESARKD